MLPFSSSTPWLHSAIAARMTSPVRLLPLALVAACVDAAYAQHAPDAFVRDGTASSRPLGDTIGENFGRGGLGRGIGLGPLDAGTPLPIRLGERGMGESRRTFGGSGQGFGGGAMRGAPERLVLRVEGFRVTGTAPLGAVTARVASTRARVAWCLSRVGHTRPFNSAIRFEIRADALAHDVTVEGNDLPLLRCARESFGRAVFEPSPQATRVEFRLVRDPPAADAGAGALDAAG